jgi:hypothetical protein
MHTIIDDNPHVVPPLGGPDDARYTRLAWPLAVAAACWTARLIPFFLTSQDHKRAPSHPRRLRRLICLTLLACLTFPPPKTPTKSTLVSPFSPFYERIFFNSSSRRPSHEPFQISDWSINRWLADHKSKNEMLPVQPGEPDSTFRLRAGRLGSKDCLLWN